MKLQPMICMVVLLLVCSVSYGQNTQSQTVNTAQNGAVNKAEADTKNMAGYNEWSNNTELGLFFTYGYAVPYIAYNDKGMYANMIGLTLNIVTPLSMCKYVALFHSFSNKFYGSFISEDTFSRPYYQSAKEFYWELSYSFGVRGYLGTRMVFVDAGFQGTLLFNVGYGDNRPTNGDFLYEGFALNGVVGLGFDYPIQPNMSVQGAFHYIFPLVNIENTSLRGFFFDLGLNWKI